MPFRGEGQQTDEGSLSASPATRAVQARKEEPQMIPFAPAMDGGTTSAYKLNPMGSKIPRMRGIGARTSIFSQPSSPVSAPPVALSAVRARPQVTAHPLLGQEAATPPPLQPTSEPERLSLFDSMALLREADEALIAVDAARVSAIPLDCLKGAHDGARDLTAMLRDRLKNFVTTSLEGEPFEISASERLALESVKECAGAVAKRKVTQAIFFTAGTVGILLLITNI